MNDKFFVRACERARTGGRPVIAVRVRDGVETPPLTQLAEAANHADQYWFYASRRTDALNWLGLGRVWDCTAHGATPLREVRAASAEIDFVFEGRDNPATLCGGAAFDAREELQRSQEWREFGSARFWLPELRIESTGSGFRTVCAARVEPGEDAASLEQRMDARERELLRAPAPSDAGDAAGEIKGQRARPSLSPSDGYARSVEEVLEAIRAKRADKVGLADAVRATLDSPVATARTLASLGAAHPGCLSFGLSVGGAQLLGATPEVLVKLSASQVEACAVAGTEGTPSNGGTSSLLASAKERSEHAFVVEAIAEALSHFCDPIRYANEPQLMGTHGLQHLLTPVRGALKNPTHVLELAERLHPTPALGGTPRAEALQLIREHEQHDRGWYAGPVGWFDAKGEGEFCVALRCGLLDREHATLYAGSGIVEASDPEREVEETALKLNTLWTALEGS